MTTSEEFVHGFERLSAREFPELKTSATVWRHTRTGAEVLSLENEDENKVFGITFRTPVEDSTGVAHILEHSVLCGSRKYPLKDPFVELSKGSLKTFLNAMTYPDKTCYPVASQNLQDFYNLVEVYLDTVLFPRLTESTLFEQGWHYELEKSDETPAYKGVVFNEMKGAFSSPERVLYEHVRQSLYPDNTYAWCSGGDPRFIPDLTYAQFKRFHQTYYHPSNAMIYFYGDDETERRLRTLRTYLDEFEARPVNAEVELQKRFSSPRWTECAYAAGEESGKKAMLSVNWMLPEAADPETTFARYMLGHILLGTPASPLRKALIDSGLGEDVVGGTAYQLRQPYLAAGLKGIAAVDAERVEELVLSTLQRLADDGIEAECIEAAVNSIEFDLRENNTGSTPRGLALMFRALSTWQYDHDPLALIGFEAPLARVKERVSSGRFFEELIRQYFVTNPHRTTVLLRPDTTLADRHAAEERKRLEDARAAMSLQDITEIIERTESLKRAQETADPAAARETLPSLELSDLDREAKRTPLLTLEQHGTRVLYHDLFTNGIAYLDLGFNLHTLPQNLLPYLSLFSRSLLQIGTEKEDFVRLTQRIGSKTGGIDRSLFHSGRREQSESASWFFLRGKGTMAQTAELLEILADVLLTVRLDNRERFRQMALESKARLESGLAPGGSGYVESRLRSHFAEPAWVSEQSGGISYLFFLRDLIGRIENDWPAVLGRLEQMRSILVDRRSMIANVTLDEDNWSVFAPHLESFLARIPAVGSTVQNWSPERDHSPFEGLTLPSPVNYVGKAASLSGTGYRPRGSAAVILKYLRTSWLWDRVRKEGGAYGVSCSLDRYANVVSFTSYRDPNLLGTLEVFDRSADFLRDLSLTDRELTRAIIGAISDLDQYEFPDARGFSSMARYLVGETDETRQQWRDEVLGTNRQDFQSFAAVLDSLRTRGIAAVLGGDKAVHEANINNTMKITRVL